MKNDITNAEHPLRKTAIRLIEEVIEPRYAPDKGINGENYYAIEDEIVKVLKKG